MARVARCVCALVLLSPALAERLATEAEAAQEIDWRKVALLGAAGAHGLSGHVVAGDEDNDKVQEPPAKNKYDRIRALLTDRLNEPRGFWSDPEPVDDDAVGKLVKHMRRSSSADRPLVERLEAGLRDGGLVRKSGPFEANLMTRVWHEPAEEGVEHYEVYSDEGVPVVVLKRFLASEPRGPAEIAALQNVLRNLHRTKDTFLSVYAQSHTPHSISKENDSEVWVMFEPFVSSLRDELMMNDAVSLPYRVFAILRVLDFVQELFDKRIPHNSVIVPDSVLIVYKDNRAKVMLCPAILNTDLKVCTMQQRFLQWLTGKEMAEDTVEAQTLLEADLKQVGGLLRWILDASSGSKKSEVVPLREVARRMTSGDFKTCREAHDAIFRALEDSIRRSLEGNRGRNPWFYTGIVADEPRVAALLG